MPPPAQRQRVHHRPLTRPPCPPPAGGWVRGVNGGQPDNLDFDLGTLQSTGAAVTVAQFRPGPGQVVLVVAAADEDAVERWLRPQLGSRLCVVPSRWARSQLDAVTAVLRDHWQDWTLGSSGEGVGDDGQARVSAGAFRVLPELAAWAGTLPDGLLLVDPVLTPAPGWPQSG